MATGILRRTTTAYAKVEATYGTDPVVAGTDALLLLEDPAVKVEVGQGVYQPYDSYGGTYAAVVGSRHQAASIKIPLHYSGDGLGSAPWWEELALAAALRSADTGTTRTITPDSLAAQIAANSSAYLILELGRAAASAQVFTIPGFRSNFVLEATVGEVPSLTFDGSGLYVAPAADATPLTPTMPAVSGELSSFRGAVMQFNAVTLHARSLVLDQGNDVQVVQNDSSTGVLEVVIAGRRITCRVEATMVVLGTRNDVTGLVAGTIAALSMTAVGTGNRAWRFDAPRAKLVSVAFGEVAGVYSVTLEFELTLGTTVPPAVTADYEWSLVLGT